MSKFRYINFTIQSRLTFPTASAEGPVPAKIQPRLPFPKPPAEGPREIQNSPRNSCRETLGTPRGLSPLESFVSPQNSISSLLTPEVDSDTLFATSWGVSLRVIPFKRFAACGVIRQPVVDLSFISRDGVFFICRQKHTPPIALHCHHHDHSLQTMSLKI